MAQPLGVLLTLSGHWGDIWSTVLKEVIYQMGPWWPERVNVVIKNEQFTAHRLIELSKFSLSLSFFIKMPLILFKWNFNWKTESHLAENAVGWILQPINPRKVTACLTEEIRTPTPESAATGTDANASYTTAMTLGDCVWGSTFRGLLWWPAAEL